MTSKESNRILALRGFFGYMGPGYRTINAVDDFMARYPRGKGIKGFEHDTLELYEACYIYKRNHSRNRKYIPIIR